MTAELESFKPAAELLAAGFSAELIPGGDAVKGQQTLDGWCFNGYPSEKNRIARRQWLLTNGTAQSGLSVEVVAYATPAQAAEAFAELTARTKACHGVKVAITGGSSVQTITRDNPFDAGPGISGLEADGSWQVTSSKGGAAQTIYTGTVAQRSGVFLSLVWSNQSRAFSTADERIISTFAAQQTQVLSTTTA